MNAKAVTKVNEVTKIKEVMKKFDSSLVAAAIQEMDLKESEYKKAKDGVKQVYASIKAEPNTALSAMKRAQVELESDVISAEVTKIKTALNKFNRSAVLEAAVEHIGSTVPQFCDSSICICPEGRCPGKIHRIDFYHSIYEIEAAGHAHLNAQRELDLSENANAVVGIGSSIGYAGLCFDSVRCFGRQIWVMHKCLSSLYAVDLNPEDLVSTIVKMAEQNPVLHKNLTKMLREMHVKGEL